MHWQISHLKNRIYGGKHGEGILLGITDKTTAAGSQLDDLALVEHLITHTLRTGMAAGRNYKDIYQDCKNRLEAMRYLQCTA